MRVDTAQKFAFRTGLALGDSNRGDLSSGRRCLRTTDRGVRNRYALGIKLRQ